MDSRFYSAPAILQKSDRVLLDKCVDFSKRARASVGLWLDAHTVESRFYGGGHTWGCGHF